MRCTVGLYHPDAPQQEESHPRIWEAPVKAYKGAVLIPREMVLVSLFIPDDLQRERHYYD